MLVIKLNAGQANVVRGRHGVFSELMPIPFEDYYFLPVDVIDDTEFIGVKNFLKALPQVDINYVEPPYPPN